MKTGKKVPLEPEHVDRRLVSQVGSRFDQAFLLIFAMQAAYQAVKTAKNDHL